MKLKAFVSCVTLMGSIFAIQEVKSEPAACCSDFDSDCYTVNNTQSNNHACNSSTETECSSECDSDATSEACKSCCVAYPHATSWECPAQNVTCLRDEYGVGSYTSHYRWRHFQCTPGIGEAAFQFDLPNADTVNKCLTMCEATGLPGCCQFREKTKAGSQNTTSVGECKFNSANGDTFAQLQNANGSEPFFIHVERRMLMSSEDTYRRAVRCNAIPQAATDPPGTDSPGTGSPATDEPTSPGTDDGGATLNGLSFTAMLAIAVALAAV